MRNIAIRSMLVLGLASSLVACTNPNDPGQRAVGGGALGAGAGAAIGGLAGGGRGALTGALLGGAVGAVGGAATARQQREYQPQEYQQQREYYPPAQPGPYRY